VTILLSHARVGMENNFGFCFVIKQNMWWEKLLMMFTKIPTMKEIPLFEGTTMICYD
jgi:hypothetical protein